MNKYCVGSSYTIRDVMEAFEHNGSRVAVIVNEEEKVIGVVSQGDIIRALVSGISLYATVDEIMMPSFLYLNARDLAAAYPMFKKKKVTLVPVVDGQFKLLSVITMDDIFAYLENGMKA